MGQVLTVRKQYYKNCSSGLIPVTTSKRYSYQYISGMMSRGMSTVGRHMQLWALNSVKNTRHEWCHGMSSTFL